MKAARSQKARAHAGGILAHCEQNKHARICLVYQEIIGLDLFLECPQCAIAITLNTAHVSPCSRQHDPVIMVRGRIRGVPRWFPRRIECMAQVRLHAHMNCTQCQVFQTLHTNTHCTHTHTAHMLQCQYNVLQGIRETAMQLSA